ncbi:MAG: MAPEG family protein [Methylobacteriaceae bacterium]|nr:MAPEG family protein [Methylobacteriaceae bacterium]
MNLTTIILAVLALTMAQIFLQETSRYGFDLRAIVGNRDNPPDMSIVAARLDRAKNNMLEALPFFLGLALLALVRGMETKQVVYGAATFLVARIVSVPAYISGVPLLRSVVWLVANAGLLAMAVGVV